MLYKLKVGSTITLFRISCTSSVSPDRLGLRISIRGVSDAPTQDNDGCADRYSRGGRKGLIRSGRKIPWHRKIRYKEACLETMVEDLRMLLREFAGRKSQPTAMILDSRRLQSMPESRARAGFESPV